MLPSEAVSLPALVELSVSKAQNLLCAYLGQVIVRTWPGTAVAMGYP